MFETFVEQETKSDQVDSTIFDQKRPNEVLRARPSGKDALLSSNWLAYQHSMDEANFDPFENLSNCFSSMIEILETNSNENSTNFSSSIDAQNEITVTKFGESFLLTSIRSDGFVFIRHVTNLTDFEILRRHFSLK